jgi:hypothetical protein
MDMIVYGFGFWLVQSVGSQAQGARLVKIPQPPAMTPTTPRQISQIVLSVGVPLTARVTDDDTESDESRPQTRRTIPATMSASEISLAMSGITFLEAFGSSDLPWFSTPDAALSKTT